MFTSTLPSPSAITHFLGLSTAEVAAARAAHGSNVLPDNAPTGLPAFGLAGG